MALRAEMINLVRLHVVNQVGQLLTRREIAVVEEEATVAALRVLINMVDAVSVEGGTAADDSMDLVTFSEQQFRQVRTVLAGDARYQCALRQECLRKSGDLDFNWTSML